MKEESPKEITRKLSIYIWLILIVAVAPLFIFFSNGWEPLLIFGIVMLLAFYGIWRLISYHIDYFIYRRINLIYKTISRLKTNRVPQDDFDFDTDIIGSVNKDVLGWAKESSKEIEQLKKQADFRKEFIGNLAHELRTPAFNLQGYLLTLLEGGLEDPKINTKYLKRADKNLERLIHLINDLDKISRIEAGKDQLEIKTFNIGSLAKEMTEDHEDRAKKKHISIRVQEQIKPLMVKADKDKVAQVFSNLITNAIRYGEEDGFIAIRFYNMDENILIEVEDNGIGIAEESIPRLFERFYRVDKSRSRHSGGTGLGLAIVKHIIDAHHQTINVRTALGEGSVFSFTLEKA